MISKRDHKIKVLAIFNKCTETTIPFENFINVNPDKFEKHILSFYQSNNEIGSFISNPKLKKDATLHGLNIKGLLSLINVFKLFIIFFKVKPDMVHVHHNFSGLVTSITFFVLQELQIIKSDRT